jgi:hypothetical protein
MRDVWEKVGHWAVRGDRISIAMVVGAERSANPGLALGGETASTGRIEGGDEPGRVSGRLRARAATDVSGRKLEG